MRQLFLDGFGSHLFNLKKVVFPPLPFYVGSYKFSKVKNAPEFVKELEIIYFGENKFDVNDFQGKVAAHRALLKVNFEYTDHVDKDEEMCQNIYNITTLNKQLKTTTTIFGVKGSSSSNPDQKGQEEEAARKAKEETTCILAEGARKLLAEESQREKEEDE